MVLERYREFVFPVIAATLFAAAFVASLFFNGVRIEHFALSLFLLTLLFLAILWRGYSRGLRLPNTPLALALTMFWAWLIVTLLWSEVPYVSMVNFWWVGSGVLVFWLMTLVPERRHPFPGVYLVVLAVGVMLALLSVYQQLRLGSHAQSTFLTRNSHAALMCLIALPASSHFLLARGEARRAVWTCRALGAVLFVLYFSIALTGSRGAILGLVIGLAVMVVMAYQRVPRARLAWFAVIVLAAYLVADVALRGDVSGRLGTFANLREADAGRFLIWQQAWRMLMDNPWWGVGLGTYWLHWPPYRHPEDASGGFYVHNDYLQIWIETGLPGLLLLLAVYAAVAMTFIRLLRDSRTESAVIVESAGLFAGLLTVAVHTFFDFDLYIHPIQLTLGLVLARLHTLYSERTVVPIIVLTPDKRLSARAWRIGSALALAVPLAYFAALGFSAVLTYHAHALVAKGRWIEAGAALTRAAQLMPTSDIVRMAHADLLRRAIPALPPDAHTERAALYRQALALLADAEAVNPLRAQIHHLRGTIYQNNPALAGLDWAQFAAESYRQALRIDPRAHGVRVAYARLLLGLRRPAEARRVLEGGIDYWYTGGPEVASYYALTAQLRRQSGDAAGATVLKGKLDEFRAAAIPRTQAGGPEPPASPAGRS